MRRKALFFYLLLVGYMRISGAVEPPHKPDIFDQVSAEKQTGPVPQKAGDIDTSPCGGGGVDDPGGASGESDVVVGDGICGVDPWVGSGGDRLAFT